MCRCQRTSTTSQSDSTAAAADANLVNSGDRASPVFVGAKEPGGGVDDATAAAASDDSRRLRDPSRVERLRCSNKSGPGNSWTATEPRNLRLPILSGSDDVRQQSLQDQHGYISSASLEEQQNESDPRLQRSIAVSSNESPLSVGSLMTIRSIFGSNADGEDSLCCVLCSSSCLLRGVVKTLGSDSSYPSRKSPESAFNVYRT